VTKKAKRPRRAKHNYITPNPPPGCRFIMGFAFSIGFGFPMRAVTLYERGQDEIGGLS